MDKDVRSKNQLYRLMGESILLDKTTELQGLKRKHLSVAFYKERMNANLKTIVRLTFEKVETWKAKCESESFEMDIV